MKARSPHALLASVLGLAALAAAVVAMAPATAGANRITDPAGDVERTGGRPAADYDIRMARAISQGDQLAFVVRVSGQPEVGDDHTVEGTGVQIEIATSNERADGCDRLRRDHLGRTDYLISTHGNPSLIDCNAPGIPVQQPVEVRKRPHALILILSKALVGDPARFGWFASTGPAQQTSDLAPDGDAAGNPVYTVHTLREPAGADRWRECGDALRGGAGAFDIKAMRLGCRQARRIADYYTWSGPDMGNTGWRCASRRTGLEVSQARCLKPTDGGRRIVRFKIGA